MYRLLMSGDPQLCASLVDDGFGSDESDEKPRLYAISSEFDTGFQRVKRFAEIVRAAARLSAGGPQPAATSQSPSFISRLKQVFASGQATSVDPEPAPPPEVDDLLAGFDETITFLDAHRDAYLLLDTFELDTMSESEEARLKARVEQEMARCVQAGAAVDALPGDIAQAGRQLVSATRQPGTPPLDAFFGLRLDDEFDSTRTGETEYPLGLQWFDTLCLELLNRSEFDAQQD
ncbi:hypothetical protein [Achromobacter sp.]|uniref:hypothetical protein n=1 Tax=Achromobacter sp. TaxID=134375 RepID=UPI0028ADE5D1|nr:hypothetical protein [Achromobacter sp.]